MALLGPNPSDALRVACQAAEAAGEVLKRYFHEGVEIRSKAPSDLVSDADVEAEHAVVDVLHAAFPDHAVMGEEAHRAAPDAEHVWIIDPLDGTSNFAHQIPHFAVSIAYHVGGEPACGVVYNPIRGDWYTADKGTGAWHNGRQLHVVESSQLNEVLVGVGFYYDTSPLLHGTLAALVELFGRQIHGIRRMGSAALDLCAVASGQFAAFYEMRLFPWDFAAGRLLVEEAGGRVTTCLGDPLPTELSTVLASNGHLHEELLSIIRPHVPSDLRP